jgi:hypothetical protein
LPIQWKRDNDGSWGPYSLSLAKPLLNQAAVPVRLFSVLCADVCRRIRNDIVHAPSKPLPIFGGNALTNWVANSKSNAGRGNWPDKDPKKCVDDAFLRVMHTALDSQNKAANNGKSLPIEFFYTLYTFTNLDTLAFEIEEALLPLRQLPPGRVLRKEAIIGRRDLIDPDQSSVKR